MNKCAKCSSYAINEDSHGRTRGVDSDLCDVCYWRKRAEGMESHIATALEQARAARKFGTHSRDTDASLMVNATNIVVRELTTALAKIKGE